MIAYSPTAITASTTLKNSRHGDGGVSVNAPAGCVLTLPAAKGTGVVFRVFIAATVTSNSIVVKAATAGNAFSGNILATNSGTNASTGWTATGTMNTLTLNGGTTGGQKGDYFEFRDVALGLWRVSGGMSETGTAASPFSTT